MNKNDEDLTGLEYLIKDYMTYAEIKKEDHKILTLDNDTNKKIRSDMDISWIPYYEN